MPIPPYTCQVMHCLITGICSKKYIVKQLRCGLKITNSLSDMD